MRHMTLICCAILCSGCAIDTVVDRPLLVRAAEATEPPPVIDTESINVRDDAAMSKWYSTHQNVRIVATMSAERPPILILMLRGERSAPLQDITPMIAAALKAKAEAEAEAKTK